MDERVRAMRTAADLAFEFLDGLDERPVGARQDTAAIRERLGKAMPETGADPAEVLRQLAEAVDPGLVGSAGPRYFGFVIGGALPAAAGADWLTTAWAQNAVLHAASPAAAAVEEVAGHWMLELLGLPADASFGLPTGAGLGNAVGLAAARHAVLDRAGWDVETTGLYGAPEISVLIGGEAHATVLTALVYLGLGRERVTRVETDEEGRMQVASLAEALPKDGRPIVVCAQAGNVNSGAFDPIGEIADLLAPLANTWLHVDGAFGLWAAAAPRLRHLVAGIEKADSWSTDAHKWLNVGYDCGFVAVRDPAAHRAAMAASAAYLMQGSGLRRFVGVRAGQLATRARVRAVGRA